MADLPFRLFATVRLEGGFDRPLDYGVPDELIESTQVGATVRVPLRGGESRGTIVELKKSSAYPSARPILELLLSPLPADLMALIDWISDYYAAPFGRVMQTAIPSAVRGKGRPKEQLWVERAKSRDQLIELAEELRRRAPAQANLLDTLLPHKGGILLTELLERSGGSRSSLTALIERGAVRATAIAIERSPIADQSYFRSTPKKLSAEQQVALDRITSSLSEGRFETHLLFGVTGSGKTEVYLQAIDAALKQGKGVIVLVPEISLTAQTIERFRSRFEGKIALLHHRLSAGERHDEWHRIRRGEAKIAIGARSALFSPMAELGLIIVDEEHEASYKQSEGCPCYHARDSAVVRGKLANATVILGSATPSLESRYNCTTGKYTLSTLTGRHEGAHLPKVQIVDMRRAIEQSGSYTLFSDTLLSALEQRHKAGEQALILLNRRGYHTSQWCPKCGESQRCPACDVTLTFHRSQDQLACHLCGYTLSPPPRHCSTCGFDAPMRFRGAGTEQVERAIHALLPELRTLRVDSDTTRHKGSCEQLLRQFRSGKADLLIGTQMIAKGLHFPAVTLVGVLQADACLQIPDFRSSEQLFQLATQVAGRAGRGALAGEVILQAFSPDHPTLLFAANHDYSGFYAEEIESRRLFGYPPFSHLIKVTVHSEDQEEARQAIETLHRRLALPQGSEALPPLPSGQPKLKNRYRFQLLLKGKSAPPLLAALRKAIPPLPKTVEIAIDVDPVSLS